MNKTKINGGYVVMALDINSIYCILIGANLHNYSRLRRQESREDNLLDSGRYFLAIDWYTCLLYCRAERQ